MVKKLLAFSTLGLLLATFAAADDTRRNLTYEISDFSGGLNLKLNEHSLPSKQAVITENVRFNKSLKSISKRDNLNTYGQADATEPITGMFRHYMKDGTKVLIVSHGDEIEKGSDNAGTFTNILNLTSGDHKWQFVTWHDILIGTDGYNQPIKYDGTSASATYLGAPLATLASSGSGPASGTYTYKCACYSASYTVLLDTPSNSITANGNDVNLTMIPICPDTTLNGESTTGRKIYRTTSSTSSYKLLSNGTIANNTATTLTDSDADAALGAAMPAGDATWTPPTGRFVLVQNNRLFFANDPSDSPSRVWYSEDGSHDIFINTSYLDIRQNDGDAITFLKGILGQLTVGKNNTIQKIYIDGIDPDTDWSISDPISYVGCQAPYSAVNTPYGIVYLAKDGIYRFNGQYSELISESVTPTIQDISPTNLENTWGVYHDNTYHLAYTSESSGGQVNNRVLVLDFLSKAYSIDLLSINAFAAFNSGNDWGVLYAGASDSGNVYAYSEEINEIVHKKHSDFTGLWDDMRYIPTDVGGDSNSPVIEIARTETIDQLSGTINSQTGTIDRQDFKGYYVSQPLAVGAGSFDKIYWNETVPAGNNVTFQIRTSNYGERNLLYNDSFEFWDNAAYGQTPSVEEPNDWDFAQDGSNGAATASTTETHRDTYSLKITKSSSGNATVSTVIPNSSNYRNKTLSFDGWFKSAAATPNTIYFQFSDGTTTRRYHYGNSGSWQEAATSLTVSATANTITASCVVTSGADAVAYFDHVMVVEGATNHNDWTSWSSELTNPTGSDISGVTADDYVQYRINMETDSLTESPNVIRQGSYNFRMLYNKEGAPSSSSIPLHYQTGWLDFGEPSRVKVIRSIESYHTGTTGNLVIEIENFEGDSDSWTIDLSRYPSRYKERTTTGALVGRVFKIDVTNIGVEPFELSKLIIKYDSEPEND